MALILKHYKTLPSTQTDEFFQLIEENSLSANTKQAYQRDLKQFYEFSNGDDSIASKKFYITVLASKGFKWATIQRKAVSIALTGEKKFLKGLKRTLLDTNSDQVIRKQVPAISARHIKRVCERLYYQKDRKSLRDRLIVLLGFLGGMRVAEISAIKVKDFQKVEEGYILRIPKSKNQELGEIGQKFYPFKSDIHTCPVRGIEKYLSEFTRDPEAYLFKGMDRGGHEISHQLSRRGIQNLIPALFGKDYSPHSMRAGMVTTAIDKGFSASQIMIQTGHKSPTSLNIYDRSDLIKRNAVTGLL